VGQEANIGNFLDHRTASEQTSMGSGTFCWNVDGATKLSSADQCSSICHRSFSSSAEAAPSAEAPAAQAHVCTCGNVFMSDAIFCRKCGKQRGKAEQAVEVGPTGSLDRVPPRYDTEGQMPMPQMQAPRLDMEINREALPNQAWLKYATPGAWLSLPMMQATALGVFRSHLGSG